MTQIDSQAGKARHQWHNLFLSCKTSSLLTQIKINQSNQKSFSVVFEAVTIRCLISAPGNCVGKWKRTEEQEITGQVQVEGIHQESFYWSCSSLLWVVFFLRSPGEEQSEMVEQNKWQEEDRTSLTSVEAENVTILRCKDSWSQMKLICDDQSSFCAVS